MLKIVNNYFSKYHLKLDGLEILKYIGPGFIVTVGFIDPGNWASNVAAGSQFGYSLLWVVTLSTLLLIIIQHNAAHLGIVSGLCLSEAAAKFIKRRWSTFLLASAVLASIATSLAELLGAAIGLNMLFKLPIMVGTILTAIIVIGVVLTRGYRMIERYIIGAISLIGLSFIYELFIADVHWPLATRGLFVPLFPANSLLVITAIIGSVVMPHNIFLHSEIIQSRQLNLGNEVEIKKHLRYEYIDTILAMFVGWAINGAIIIMAATVFFYNNITVNELSQAEATLRPLLGNSASTVFAGALILAGFSSAISSALAGGSIFAGYFNRSLDLTDKYSRLGVLISIGLAAFFIFFISDPFKGLIWSQVILCMQLPLTVFALIVLTSSEKVMGQYRNRGIEKLILWSIAIALTIFNGVLLSNQLF